MKKQKLHQMQFVINQVLSNWRQFEMMLSNSRINYYYCTSFLVIVTAVLVKLPSLVTSAEFYAETMTIFFKEATQSSFWEILTYVEADYLITFQLLVSFVLVRVFGVIEYFPGIVNFIFLLFVAFSVSLINLRAFRVLIASDYLRFMIGISIGLTPYLEVYQLLHANLFGFLIFLLFIFVDKDQFNRWLFYSLIFLMFMVGIARPNMVAFLPVYMILLGMAIKSNRIRDIIFYGAGSASLSLQAYAMIMGQLFWSSQRHTGIYTEITGIDNFISPIFITIVYYLRTLLAVVFKEVSGRYVMMALIFILTALILTACYYLYRKKRFIILYYFCLSQILALGLIYFIAFSSPSVRVDWSFIQYDPMRWWAYSNLTIYISLMVLASNTVQEILSRIPDLTLRNISSRVAIIFLSVLPILFHIRPFYNYNDPYAGNESLSNWAVYRELLKDNDYYIPINPDNGFKWALQKDNERINFNFKDANTIDAIDFDRALADVNLRGVVIVNHQYNLSMKDLILRAYDKNGKVIAIPRRLDNVMNKYLYYYFPVRINPHSIGFFNEKLESVDIKPDFYLLGKHDTE